MLAVELEPKISKYGKPKWAFKLSYTLSLQTNNSQTNNSPEALSKYSKRNPKGLVSKETVVLRRWGSETQKFGFIN